MFTKALVPLDGSDVAEGILPYVSQLAAGMGMPLALLTVIDPDSVELPVRVTASRVGGLAAPGEYVTEVPREGGHTPGGNPLYAQVLQKAEEQARSKLEKFAASLRESGVQAEMLVAFGSAPEQIIEVARGQGCDLIAMSTHGRGPLGRIVLGSVTDKVIHASTVPVLTIRPERARAYRNRQDIIDKVLVPLDGSQLAEAALPYVEELGGRMSLEVLVARVVTRETLHMALAHGYEDAGDPSGQVHRYVTDYLKAVTDRMKAKGLKAEWKVLYGHPAASIIELANEVGHDMIALTTHGRSGIIRWALGSVAEAVVRSSGHPVLVIPPKAASGS